MAVYLDHAATSPIRPEVLSVYLAALQEVGNPSSVHSFGQSARRNLEEARESLAKSLDCHRSEVIFTAGGTESDNSAIIGLYWARNTPDASRRLVVTAGTEHHAVIETVEWLENTQGAEGVFVPVTAEGQLDLSWLRQFVAERHDEIALISLMWANNETGVIFPISDIVALAKPYGIPVHSDAVAAFGQIPISFKDSGLTAMSITGHKIGAPVGVGALIASREAKISPTSHGGAQERGIRSGTLSPALATAFAKAAEVAIAELPIKSGSVAAMRDRLVAGVKQIAPDAVFSRGSQPGLPGTAHFTFPGCSGDSLLFVLDMNDVSVSNGSACRAGVAQASHVLLAMGRSRADASSALRISMNCTTTEADVDAFLAQLPKGYESAKAAGMPSK
ncbi:cysteine desulfurase family protein [Rhodoluna sp.]|uniref:cysteine desulfurase family protein n=1 Tax=Rhodoluna sp. TaxID=1969481 RepID=UPI0025CF6D08|nr:cysteine desulfurase family protein [Rhodoluna sp.]